jgi:predicted acyltransferase
MKGEIFQVAQTPPDLSPHPVRTRVESVDAFRGLSILLMIYVIAVAAADYRNLPQSMSWFGSLPVSTWNHAEVGWDRFVEEMKRTGLTDGQIDQLPQARLKNVGLTVTDLVAPFFVFIVGIAIPLSRSRRGVEWWHHVMVRTFMLILAGVVYISLIFGLSWWWGILQAIGVAYFMGAASIKLSRRGRWIAIVGLLAFHMLMSHYVGWWLHWGESPGPFWTISQVHGNWMKPLTIHCRPWVSISYGVMTMIGVLIGEAVATGERAAITRVSLTVGCLFAGIGFGVHTAGLATGATEFCFNKPDVTASYAMFASGMGSLAFLALYYVIDVWRVKKWAYPLKVFGANALLSYFLQVIMRIFFRALHLEPFFSGQPNDTLQQWAGLFDTPGWSAFLLDKTGYNGVLWGLIWTFCLWLIVWYCNKRNIYWRL